MLELEQDFDEVVGLAGQVHAIKVRATTCLSMYMHRRRYSMISRFQNISRYACRTPHRGAES